MRPEVSDKNFALVVAVLIVVHIAIAVPMAWSLNIWMDEASSLYATQNGFWHTFQTAAAEQKQAPLYFWLLSIWRSVDESVFFARLFSIICSVGAVAVFSRIARRFFSNFSAIAVTAFFAVHPFLIWASTEIRVYSLVVLLSVVLLSLFLDAFFDNAPRSPSAQWWFLGTAIVSLYTNYYLAFVIAALFIALVLTGRVRASARYAGLMLIAVAAFVPLVAAAATELGARSDGMTGGWAFAECVRTVWHHFLTFLLPTEMIPTDKQTPASFVRLWVARALIAAAIVSVVVYRKNISRQTTTFGVVTLGTAALLVAAGLFVGHLLIATRHASVMFAAMILAAALLLKDIAARLPAKAAATVLAGLFLISATLFSYSLTNIYPHGAKNGDWAEVAKFIELNEAPGQPIVVFQAYESLAPRVYYTGPNQILPDERLFEFVPGGRPRSAGNIRAETDFVISEIPPEAAKVWFVLTDFCLRDDRCSVLRKHLDANYAVEIEKDFYLTKVYLLRRKPAGS